MRHLLASSDFRAGFAEMLPACIGLIPFGVVCGVGAAAAGASWLAALGMSAIIFSGAAQVLAGQMLAGGAPFLVIALTCFVLGLRFLMYSAAMAPYLKALPGRWQQALAFLLTDQAFASAIRRFNAKDDPHGGAQHFLGCGVALWTGWQITNMLGFFAGNLIPPSWSLEFAVPLCFIALVAPLFRDTPTILAAVTAGIGVIVLQGLPMKLNLIAAGIIGILVGAVADLTRERWTQR
ncbi:MAG: AzlC family ABC transporter permease [Betaproteobacteria bacterium]